MNSSWPPSPINPVKFLDIKPPVSRLLAGAAGLALLCAGYFEGVAAYAGHLAADRSLTGLRAAAALTPTNGDLWRAQGLVLVATDPVPAAGYFQHAVDLNPADAGARVALGLLAESDGRLEEAERHLRAAAAVSRRAKPHLALAFFYARQGPLEEFWRSANRVAAIDRADLKPLFAVAHAVVPNPTEVAGALHLNSRDAIAAYVQFLLDRPERAPLAETALRLEPVTVNRPILIAVTDRLLKDGRIADAIRVWNLLYPGSLDPAAARSIVNSGFEPGDGAGFDWRHTPSYGIGLRRAPGDLRIEFSGRQPENAVLIEQYVPVLPRRAYRLIWTASMHGIALRSGIFWQIGRSLLAPIPPAAAANGSANFETAAGETLIRLALQYSRPAGTTRLDGVVSLNSVELRLR